jgi:WD40 repeat protein
MMILEKLKPKQVIKYCLITNKKLCENIDWPYLLKIKFPNDFKSDDDIIKKYKWLEDKKDPNIYQNKDSKYLFTIFAFGKKDELKKKAFKCFYYWAKGWSRVLEGHANIVNSVMKLNETTIVSGSADNTLRVWDLTNDTSRVLRGHTDYVWSVIKLNDTTIVSGSSDNTLRVWDLTNDTSRVLEGHTRSVLSVMKLNDTTIVSGGGGDNTLRVWDLTNDTSRVLRGHTGFVYTVIKLNETTIVSISSDRTLRVWYGYF